LISLLGQNRSMTKSNNMTISSVVDPIKVAHRGGARQGGRPTFWASVVRRA
jgi:hypothetical protein